LLFSDGIYTHVDVDDVVTDLSETVYCLAVIRLGSTESADVG